MPLDHQQDADDMFRRNQSAIGETMINVATGLMREVRDEVRALRSEITDINRERREEARESGSNKTEIDNLKRRLNNNDRFTVGLSVAILAQMLWAGVQRYFK